MRMRNQSRRAALAVAATCSALLLAACGGGGGSDGAKSPGECKPAKDGEQVTLTFSSWVPGMQETVDLWNKENPDIQVEYKAVPDGQGGTYQAYSNQLKAGNAGDLGMVELDSMPSFRLQDGLMDIGGCPGVQDAAAEFLPWTIEQVGFGEEGAIFGIPQDVGPLAMYYRKDLFERARIPVPTTWEEFHAVAKQVKAKGGLITNFPPDGPALFAGLAWQNEAKWFGSEDGVWKVSMTDEATKEVAEYWQRMLDEDLVDTLPGLSPTHWNAVEKDKHWTLLGAAWTAKLLEDGAPGTSGKWAVAPLPQWTAGDEQVSGNWGGSATVVFKGSKHPAEAAKFAAWAFSDLDALALNNKNGGQFPATEKGQTELPALTEPYPFYGGQVIWEEFQKAASSVDTEWTWGPTMTQTFADLTDGISAAVNGKGTLADGLKKAEAKTISTMKSQAIDVAP